MTPTIRPPAVAGGFYPGNANILRRDVEAMLAAANLKTQTTAPKALICPHAGYIYSGPIAASAYKRLAPVRSTIKRVVLLGPTHRVPVRGLAVPSVDAFCTPLGDIPIDATGRARLLTLPQVTTNNDAHALEHSLEVQLPFLQNTLDDFTLLPITVGNATAQAVADAVLMVWGGQETLIVVSSDLSHYLTYAAAQHIDQASVRQILDGEPNLSHQQACGATPINGLVLAAKKQGLRCELIDLRNSGDTAGDKTRVVGYAAFAFFETDASKNADEDAVATTSTDPDDALGKTLLGLARESITRHLTGAPSSASPRAKDMPALNAPGATFVTLTQHGQLRGCIGSLEAHRPLADDVCQNALGGAFRDPRFPPLQTRELDITRVEVSLLTPPEPFPVRDEDDACRRLAPLEDGLIFQVGQRRATFLPQVWEQLPTPRLFLSRLKEKAGFTPDYWSSDVQLFRYRVKKWKEDQ